WRDPPTPILDPDPVPKGALARLEPSLRSLVFGAISPDGSLLATRSPSTSKRRYPIRIWDPRTGKDISLLAGQDKSLMSMAFCRDKKIVASGGMDDMLRFWDLETGKEIGSHLHNGHVYSLCFSPDGKLLASGSHDSIRFWDTKQKELPRFYA